MIYDISPAITLSMGVYPGDTPPSRETLMDMAKGDVVTVSTLRSTVHVGAHLDAPSHYNKGAETIDQQDLELCVGPCQVIRVEARRGERFGPEAINVAIGAPRVLLATGTYPDPKHYNEDFAAPTPELIEWLSGQGVELVGIDTPSVDDAFSKDLPSHKKVAELDMRILEGLVLDKVPEGLYELIALPLKLAGFDASPVRAILRVI